MIDNINGFLKEVLNLSKIIGVQSDSCYNYSFKIETIGNMYCPTCSGERRMNIILRYSPIITTTRSEIININSENDFYNLQDKLLFSVWEAKCTQCDSLFTIVFYQNNSQVNMAILSHCNSGIASPNTPISVRYYLDQAYRAKSIGANSASMSMYRAALEQILYEQGYTNGMLGNKLQQLEKDKKNNCGKKWINELDISYLTYLNKLGSSSIHPNDGNIDKQMAFDNELLELVDIVFSMLLDKIYEQPKKEEIWLNTLKEKQESFKY